MQAVRREATWTMPEAEEEAAWAPPTGQTGDGRTALNAKLGY